MPPSHTCKCLNIRIFAEPATSGQISDLEASPGFTHLRVKENDGISITHPHLTCRDSGLSSPQSNSQVCTLSCLICKLPTYRVRQTPLEGPALSADRWFEQEPLQSHSGWVQVNDLALTGTLISGAESQSAYSPTFKVLIPLSDHATPLPQPALGHVSSPKQLFPEKQLFPPPPFSPKHPVFQNLASIAQRQSSATRIEADAAILAMIKEIDIAEQVLRRDSEQLWGTFTQHVSEVERRIKEAATTQSSQSSSTHPQSAGAASGPVSVHDFVPEPISRSTQSRPSPGHVQMSSLSASLKTSGFQHPQTNQAPPERSRSSKDLASSPPSEGPRSAANGTIARSGPSSVLHFRRVKEDDRDIAASYQVLLSMEEQSARHEEREAEKAITAGGIAPASSKPSSSQRTKPVDKPKPSSGQSSKSTKGKRTVTFDVETGPQGDPRTSTSEDLTEDMVFDLEEEDGLYVQPQKPTEPVEPSSRAEPRSTRRPTRQRQAEAGLSTSYAALRPSSLPAPSTIRAASARFVPEENPAPILHPASPSTLVQVGSDGHKSSADGPSDLSRKGGPAWKQIVERKGSENDDELSSTPSDDGDDDEYDGPRLAVGSLPIPVRSLAKRDIQLELTVASYQPSAALPPTSGGSMPAGSSKSMRRAIYAERDRDRSIDAGPLAYVAEEDGDDELPELPEDRRTEQADRSKQNALKILQRQAEIPHAGMWRSLAD